MSEAEAAAENNPYQKFYEVCDHPGIDLDEVIKKSGLVDESQYDINNPSQLKQLNAAIAKYSTFTDQNGVDFNVSFWQNYNYTVFAPTNEAMDKAYEYSFIDAKGTEHKFPKWEDIIADFDNCDKDEDGNLIINEEEAKIVKRIYREYLEGRGYYDIGKGLEADGILTAAGNSTWRGSTIRNILRNEK